MSRISDLGHTAASTDFVGIDFSPDEVAIVDYHESAISHDFS